MIVFIALSKGRVPVQLKIKSFDDLIVHRKDLKERLKGKISYTPIGFSLVPKYFTWSELQDVYEIILGEKLVAPNFRRDIEKKYKIKELTLKSTKSVGRNPKLLEFLPS